MSLRYEIRLSGFGGQGLILAGIILAEAAGINENKYVAQSQSYGPEARGGKSRADVIISDEPIDFPKPVNIDLLLAMSQEACDRYFIDLHPSGILIVDSTLVKEVPLTNTFMVPCTEIARKLGNQMIANMVALGAICTASEIVSASSLKKAIKTHVPLGSEKINIKAFNAGLKGITKAV